MRNRLFPLLLPIVLGACATTTDLEQLLESILTTLCDFMLVRTGFVVVMEDRALSIRILSGSRDQANGNEEPAEKRGDAAHHATRPRNGSTSPRPQISSLAQTGQAGRGS